MNPRFATFSEICALAGLKPPYPKPQRKAVTVTGDAAKGAEAPARIVKPWDGIAKLQFNITKEQAAAWFRAMPTLNTILCKDGTKIKRED